MGKLRKGLEKGREGEGKERGKKGMWVASSPKIIAMCFVFLVDVNHTGASAAFSAGGRRTCSGSLSDATRVCTGLGLCIVD